MIKLLLLIYFLAVSGAAVGWILNEMNVSPLVAFVSSTGLTSIFIVVGIAITGISTRTSEGEDQ